FRPVNGRETRVEEATLPRSMLGQSFLGRVGGELLARNVLPQPGPHLVSEGELGFVQSQIHVCGLSVCVLVAAKQREGNSRAEVIGRSWFRASVRRAPPGPENR